MKKASTAKMVLLVMFFAAVSAVAEQAPDPLTQLAACAQITDTPERVACYESLGKRVLQTKQASAPAVEQTAAPVAATVVTTSRPVEPKAQLPPAAVEKTLPVAATPAVVEKTLPVVAAPAAVEKTLPVVAASPSLPDEIGGGQFDKKGAEAVPEERGQVISCRHDPNYYYSFTFDNGQIWRQTDGRRFRRPHHCEFVAIISRDRFGYKMQVEGDEHKYRVKRIR